jgi:hypothetical protein
MITGEQLRAALSALRWSRRILHEHSGVAERTIQRAAEASGVPSINARLLVTLQEVLEKGNDEGYIEFIQTPGPGVVFHRKTLQR